MIFFVLMMLTCIMHLCLFHFHMPWYYFFCGLYILSLFLKSRTEVLILGFLSGLVWIAASIYLDAQVDFSVSKKIAPIFKIQDNIIFYLIYFLVCSLLGVLVSGVSYTMKGAVFGRIENGS